MWMYLGLWAALFLGLHNICKKHAVQGNAVLPVLLGTIFSGFLLLLPLFLISTFAANYAKQMGFL